MVNIVVCILAIIAVFVGYILNDSWRMMYFSATGADNGKMPLVDMSKCPAVDMEAFGRRVFTTPAVEVDTIEECLRHGENMNQPLICRLPGTGSNEQKIIDAIFADDSTYEMVCRDEGDFHYNTHWRKMNATIADVASNPSPCSAGFIYGDKHQALLQSVMPTMHNSFEPATVKQQFDNLKKDSFLAGTSFASNFENHRISTGSHAAMVTSMAYQLAGTKKWILHDMEESTSDYIYQNSWRLFPTCLESFLTGLKRPYVAVTRPGDILFFPYAWEHLVFTDPGPNVMTNIRKVSKTSPLSLYGRFSLKNIAKVIFHHAIATDITGNPRVGADNAIMRWSQKVRDNSPELEKENVRKLTEYLTKF
jgi:hypothetical protein